MKKQVFIFITIFLISCNGNQKEARSVLEKARALYENTEYSTAKQALDELKTQYPKEVEIQKEGLHLMRQIDLKEQQRNLLFCDSVLIVRQAEADSIKRYFIFEKDPEYDTTGKYIEKKLAASSSSRKLQSGVYENGEIYLKSVYSGASALRHNQLKVSLPTGEFMQTEAIPFDGGANYSFKDDNTGLIHESVTYQKGRDNEVMRFIYNHPNEKLTVQYLGGKSHSFVLAKPEIESLLTTVDLSIAISDVQKLQREKTKAEERIAYLQSKIE
jgi:hypothetical protein